LRDGKNTAKLTGPEINIKNMVNNMLARELTEQYQRPQNIPKAEIMIEVDQISSLPLLNNVSFKIKKGEILGIVGLLGSGKTELARALIGINKNSGTIKVQGKVVKNLKVIDALKAGIILVPEERKSQAILPDLNVFYNGIVTYANINYYDKYWKIFKNNTLKAKVESILKELSVKYTNLNRITKGLSGGNQQKLVIGRVLLCNPKLLILDEPTRGIDVGSKSDVYSIIQNAVKNDLTVLIMSGELEEMAVICHRILVLSNGEILGEFNPQKSSTDEIKELMGGLNQERKRENV
jgi:methyl-galactoside transport system ATP-binding protein